MAIDFGRQSKHSNQKSPYNTYSSDSKNSCKTVTIREMVYL